MGKNSTWYLGKDAGSTHSTEQAPRTMPTYQEYMCAPFCNWPNCAGSTVLSRGNGSFPYLKPEGLLHTYAEFHNRQLPGNEQRGCRVRLWEGSVVMGTQHNTLETPGLCISNGDFCVP